MPAITLRQARNSTRLPLSLPRSEASNDHTTYIQIKTRSGSRLLILERTLHYHSFRYVRSSLAARLIVLCWLMLVQHEGPFQILMDLGFDLLLLAASLQLHQNVKFCEVFHNLVT